MKVNTKVLALMTALAAGVASAAPTAVNTSITNTASASFSNPAYDPNKAEDPVTNPKNGNATSNTVTTKVLPLPSFDISYPAGTSDGGGAAAAPNPANSATATTPVQQTVAPGATATTPYVVTNTGNVPLTISITSQAASAADTSYGPASTAGDPSAVTYTYTYTDKDGVTQTVTKAASGVVYVPAGGSVTITQNTTIPSTAGSGAAYGATPVGTVTGTGTTVADNGIVSGSTLYESQTVDTSGAPVTTDFPAGSDLQYAVIKATVASVTNAPNVVPSGTTSTVTPPTDPNNPNPTGTYDAGTPPAAGTTGAPPSGATSPGSTPIAVFDDKQVAYPPADGNTNNDVVQFKNTVTNGSGASDTMTLSPGPLTVGTDGKLPTLVANTTTVTDINGQVWTYTGTGTWVTKDTTGNVVNTVQFLDPTSKAPVDTVVVPANSSASYLTQITYPDSNPNAGTTTLDQPKAVTVIVNATSGNNPNVKDTTTNVIYPPAATFGDQAAEKGTAGSYVEDPSKAYYPGSTLTATTTAPGATATFPMNISNTGQYPDKYTLAGAVAIPTTDGGYKIVPVNYVGTGSTTLSSTVSDATKVSDTQVAGTAPVTVTLPDGTTKVVYAPVYTTSVVNPGSVATVDAKVTVPTDAAATGSGTAPKVSQTATGVNSTIAMIDNNDLLPIGAVGSLVVGKFTETKDGTPTAGTQYAVGSPATVSTNAPAAGTLYVTNPEGFDGTSGANPNTSYQPNQEYDYQILAKNGYNSPVSNFQLKDTLNANLTFVTATCTIFNKDGSKAFTDTLSTITGSDVICPAHTLPEGGSANLTITVKIK